MFFVENFNLDNSFIKRLLIKQSTNDNNFTKKIKKNILFEFKVFLKCFILTLDII